MDARQGEGEPSWADADGATWRALAVGLLELDQQRLYLSEGYRCTAQYADGELGLTRKQTEELLRIGKKLVDLPQIDHALRAGWLTWAHVVVLTRVAVPKHEAAWLERALDLPAGGLALLVERSAEGWAPPVASGERAQASEASLGWVAEAFLAPPSSRRARLSGGLRFVRPGLAGRIVVERLRRACATAAWRRHSAPNVRQPSGAPPSTS
jgi:hypothetical protein